MIDQTILIVGNKTENREKVKNILSDKFQMVEASFEDAGTFISERVNIAAIVLDDAGSLKEEEAFITAVRSSDKFSDLPMIAIAGEKQDEVVKKLFGLGVTDFLEEPFCPAIVCNRIKNVILFKQALFNAKTDPLTLLFNRTTFLQHVDDYLNKIKNTDEKAALLIIDIDNFKQINDTMGHSYGDSVLIKLAGILKEAGSDKCYAGRLGGDEFIVLLKDLQDNKEAEAFANRILDLFNQSDSEEIRADNTCSVGIAVFPKNSAALSELYFCADEAMYESKRLGRNRVSFYGIATDILRRNSSMNKEWLLDEQDSYIYICDAETHEVYYANEKSLKLLRSLGENDPKCFCYHLGFEGIPFYFCSHMPLNGKNTTTAEITNPKGERYLYKCKNIIWNERLSRMSVVSKIE